MPTTTSSTSFGMRMAQAAAAKTRQRRPAPPVATSTATRPPPSQIGSGKLGRGRPSFLQGSRAAAAPVASFMPQGNAQAEMQRRQMPQTLTSMMRSEGLQNNYGPIIGPRAQMATVASFQGLGGFSIRRLTRWVTSATSAIASKDPAAILAVAAAAVPGGSTPPPVAPKPMQPPPSSVEQFYTSMKPQNSTQTMMMVGAGVLGLGLVALLLRRR